jgi:hypothetical protein
MLKINIEPLNIEKTEFTPSVSLNNITHKFRIEGVSRPENVMLFYNQILEWFIEYEGELYKNKKQLSQSITLKFEFQFMYFNSASAKMVFTLLESLNRIKLNGFDVNIVWFYEDGDDKMYEDGLELSEALSLPFEFEVFS